MSVTLKFVKGAYLSTYTDRAVKDCKHHIVLVDWLLRIKSKTKPPATESREFDLKLADLASVRKVLISAPPGKDGPQCINHNPTLADLAGDRPLNPESSLIAIQVTGGTFSYPHNMLELPLCPGRRKAVGWIQVDFDKGPVTVELLSDNDALLRKETVYDGQAFDMTGYIMYKYEESALDEEPLSVSIGSSGPSFFKVLEAGDGTGGPPPGPS